MTNQCAGGDCLVLTPTDREVELRFPPLVGGGWVLLCITFTLGVITGFLLARLVDLIRRVPWISWLQRLVLRGPQRHWQRLVGRAITFVNKRRLVSFAFNNYKSYSLRNTAESLPTSLRRRRKSVESPKAGTVREASPGSGGLTPLEEGPVTPPRFNHGSDRSRTQRYHHLG